MQNVELLKRRSTPLKRDTRCWNKSMRGEKEVSCLVWRTESRVLVAMDFFSQVKPAATASWPSQLSQGQRAEGKRMGGGLSYNRDVTR